MKTAITMASVIPAICLIVGYTNTDKKLENVQQPTLISVPHHTHKPIPGNPPPRESVVVQIDHQGFPFDLDGNFPYVVMVDNVVWTFNKEDVYEFLLKAKYYPDGPGEGRTREVSTKK